MDVQHLLEEAERRWQKLLAKRPDLGPAIDLQRRLVGRSLALGSIIDARPETQVGVTPAAAASKLRQRRPAFAGETRALDATGLVPFVLGFCEDFANGGAGPPAERLHDVLQRGEIDVESLLSSSLARQQAAIRAKAQHVGVAPDLLWLVAELGVAPLANRAQQTLLTKVAASDQPLCSAVGGWQEGYCPACGSWPAYTETIEHTRSLRCSFCGRSWTPLASRCIYCGETGESLLIATDDTTDPRRRVELCRRCGGYLKSFDVKRRTPFELLPVADLETNDLDVGAAGRGYARPPMRDLAAI